MPYDLYEYFRKQRTNEKFIEITDIVRENIWRETYDVVKSQEHFFKRHN